MYTTNRSRFASPLALHANLRTLGATNSFDFCSGTRWCYWKDKRVHFWFFRFSFSFPTPLSPPTCFPIHTPTQSSNFPQLDNCIIIHTQKSTITGVPHDGCELVGMRAHEYSALYLCSFGWRKRAVEVIFVLLFFVLFRVWLFHLSWSFFFVTFDTFDSWWTKQQYKNENNEN